MSSEKIEVSVSDLDWLLYWTKQGLGEASSPTYSPGAIEEGFAVVSHIETVLHERTQDHPTN